MPDYSAYKNQRIFGSLDGIRCMSILAVIWHHSRGDVEFGRIATRGFLGVDMFFVLSGFLIVTLLLRETERTGTISLKDFYARRTLRIMPLYYGVVLVSVGVVLGLRPDGASAQSIRESLPYLLTYTTNWVEVDNFLDVTWSLATEEQFYLIWPPIQKYAPRPLWILFALLVVSQLIHFGAIDRPLERIGFGPDDLGMLRQTGFTPILLGVLLAHILNDRRGFAWTARLVGARWTPVVLSIVLVVCLELFPQDLRGWPRASLHLLLMALLASVVVREDHALAPFLKWPPIVRIGVLSYGMYLLHMFVVHVTNLLGERGMPEFLMFPLAVLGTTLVAELSYRFYETPFLKLKKRFAR